MLRRYLPVKIRMALNDLDNMKFLAREDAIAVFFRGKYFAVQLEKRDAASEASALKVALKRLGWDSQLRRRKNYDEIHTIRG